MSRRGVAPSSASASVTELRHRAQLYHSGVIPQHTNYAQHQQSAFLPPTQSIHYVPTPFRQAQQHHHQPHSASSYTNTNTNPSYSRDTSYREESESDYSDSGSSTYTGSRHHDDYSSYDSSYYSSSSAYSHPHRRRSSGQHHRIHTDEDHTDCVSCTSSCSCSSGCDSDTERAAPAPGAQHSRRHSHGRRHSMDRASGVAPSSAYPGSSLQASRGSTHVQTREPSREPSRHASRAHSRRPSQAASIIDPQSRVASLVNTQRTGRSRRSASADLTGRTFTVPIGGVASATASAVQSQATTSRARNEDAAMQDLAEALKQEEMSNRSGVSSSEAQVAAERAQTDALHVTFDTPRDSAASKHAVYDLQKQEFYDSALACIERAEQGFHAYVLSSEHAAVLNASAEAEPPATVLLRKLLRYEPRRSKSPLRGSSTSQTYSGSGNLVWYDLVLDGENRPQRFRLSAKEQEEVRRLYEMEREKDLREGRVPQPALDQEELENWDPNRSPFVSEQYAALLKERKTLKLTIERKAGIIPVRKIREMRSGIIPGATRLVNVVNSHFDELNIAEDETIIAEHCVSLLLDSGIARHHHAHDHHAASASAPRSEHDRKHAECISKFDPEICPRVPSSFERANVAASRKLQREIRRNQKKHYGTRHLSQWGHSQGHAPGDLNTSSMSSHSYLNSSQSFASSIGTSGSAATWVVVATNSRDEASVLLNSLMFLKMVSGRAVRQRTQAELEKQRKREIVELPPAGSPAPSPSKRAEKRRKKGHSDSKEQEQTRIILQPTQLTSALMLSAAEHVALNTSSTSTATVKSGETMSHRAFLKRKSAPTPSVKVNFGMPNASVNAAAASSSNQAKSSPANGAHRTPVKPKTLPEQWVASVKKSEEKLKAAVRIGSEDEQMEESQTGESSFHPLASATAVFVPSSSITGSGATPVFTPAASSSGAGAGAGNTASSSNPPAAVVPSTPATIEEWLEKKRKAEEKEKEREARKKKKEEEEKQKNQQASEEAVKKWKARHEAEEKKLALKQKRKVEADAKLAAEKAAKTQARKEACLKAYRTFLENYEKKRKETEQKEKNQAAETAAEQRRKKQEAKKKFQEWIKKKSDWFVSRVQQIKKRAKERRERGDGDMTEEDPEEEAALDWQWLEKEVEAELSIASGRTQKKKGKGGKGQTVEEKQPELNPESLSLQPVMSEEAEMLAAGVDDDAEDVNALYQVLDEVDMELWSKLMAGLESTRDEVERLKLTQPLSPLAKAFEEQDRDRQHAATRVPLPAPLGVLKAKSRLGASSQRPNGNVPVQNVPIHDETLEFGSASGVNSFQTSTGVSSSSSTSIRRSPFLTDPHAVAKESILRPAAANGAYTQLVKERGGIGNVSVHNEIDFTNRTLLHHPLPAPAVRPYAGWVREELHQAMGFDQRQPSSAAPPHSASIRPSSATDPRTIVKQKFPVAHQASQSYAHDLLNRIDRSSLSARGQR